MIDMTVFRMLAGAKRHSNIKAYSSQPLCLSAILMRFNNGSNCHPTLYTCQTHNIVLLEINSIISALIFQFINDDINNLNLEFIELFLKLAIRYRT